VNIETAHVKLYVLRMRNCLADIAEAKKDEFTLLPAVMLCAAHGWRCNIDINSVTV
jgi:hypothetical protein